MTNPTPASQGGFIADTPEAISVVQLITVKSALKLEAKGMQMTRGPKLRKPWALKFGLKANAKYEEVIAHIEGLLEKAKQDPKALLKRL